MKQLIDPTWALCVYCREGRKNVCATWDGRTRALPVPPMLDVRVPADAPGASLENREES